MTKLLEQALAATDKLPPVLQDELAQIILAFTCREHEAYKLSDEELASLETSLAEADRGEYATDQEVASLWAKNDR